nr:malonate decarboxylase gamma subunit {N-terminal} [Acinetobacter calcoaceticus, Peptide Partial, 15 aa] [Acinetobacter calcoaceticus]
MNTELLLKQLFPKQL